MDAIQILIVEDEPIAAYRLQDTLQAEGYQVVAIVDSAESVIPTLKQTQPQIVLMTFPLRGKIESISLVQDIQKTFETPVVYVGAEDDRETIERVKLAHPCGYLLKPYRLLDLKVTIEIALDRYRQESAGRRQIKDEIDKVQKIQQEFLTNIKHEIRTPMNVIQGFCQILQYEIDNPRLHSYLDAISESSELLMKLLEDIIELSKIEAGDIDRPFHPLDIRALLWEIGHIASRRAEAKNLALIDEIPPDLPALIWCEEISLKQILSHLLDNSLKFTERGTVTLAVSSRDLFPDPAIELTISVKDTGIGISPSTQSRIFERFSQADNSLTRSYGGIGIGLTISQRLTEYLGGRLELESEEGQGSTFRLVFPRIPVVAEEKEELGIDRKTLKL